MKIEYDLSDKKRKKRDEIWTTRLMFFFMMINIVLVFSIVPLTDKIQRLEINFETKENPEVINGNLYIGYEDGKRIGYHYWNNTWFRNGIELKEFMK